MENRFRDLKSIHVANLSSEKMIGSVPCGECEMRVSRTNAFVAAPFSLSFSAAHANQPQPIVLIYDCLHEA